MRTTGDKQEKRWKIIIVSHEKIIPEFYQNDTLFPKSNFEILNVGEHDHINNCGDFRVINQYDIPNARNLGKSWAESEGLLNYWYSGEWKQLDYVGFIHYDLEWKLDERVKKIKRTNITKRINSYLSGKDTAHISFESHIFEWDLKQRILADVSQPDLDIGEGVNCYTYILDDYNTFFGTHYTVDDLKKSKKINLCSCFLIDVNHFDEMMSWFEYVVNKGELLVFTCSRKQGSLAERYFGVYMSLAYDKALDLSLIHHWNDGLK